ncbi:MAG: cell wall hydrolase [Clostridia bacterium]|nr:cell wall hydrolase [Clostridia bacterium]
MKYDGIKHRDPVRDEYLEVPYIIMIEKMKSKRGKMILVTFGILCAMLLTSVFILSASVKAAYDEEKADMDAGVSIEDERTARAAHLLASAADAAVPESPYLVRLCFCAVMLNRVKSAEYPDTLAGVIFDSGILPDPGAKVSSRSLRAALDALDGSDPTRGAKHYAPEGEVFTEPGDLRIRVRCGGWDFY